MSDLMFGYQRFAGAITRGDEDELKQLVNHERFRAILPGDVQEEGIDFAAFVLTLEHRRAAFSDFGQNVEIRRVFTDGNRVVVYYAMDLTHDGTLASRADASAPPSGCEVHLTAVDIVAFDAEGLVTELINVSDRLATLEQMGVL